MYGMKAVIDAIEAEREQSYDYDLITEIDAKKTELQKEKQKYFDQRAAFNKIVRERSRQEELNDILTESIRNGDLPALNYVENVIESSDNDLLVSLNDLHYGIDVDNYWNKYNTEICAEMLRRYLDSIFRIQKTHGSENCIVWANGDMISGNIHYTIAIQNKENVVEQIKGVSELIAEFLAELSKHFKNVTYVSVAGNHSRVSPNKDTALKDERLDDLVEWYLKARLDNFDNITIGGGDKIDETMYVIEVRGKNYCGVHGDYDGSAAKISTLQTFVGRQLYAVLSGHLHHNAIDEVHGVKTIMAGSFVGMDDYCIQKRIYGKPEQLVLVCDESGVVCSYDVSLK